MKFRTENLELTSKVSQGYLGRIAMTSKLEEALLDIVQGAGVDLAKGETDVPVTSDIKRLIRLPTSLHGRTGLRVVGMSRAALDDFDPLRDAVPDTFGDDPVRLEVTQPFDVRIRSERFNLTPGVADVPEFAAVFLTCRGVARVG